MATAAGRGGRILGVFPRPEGGWVLVYWAIAAAIITVGGMLLITHHETHALETNAGVLRGADLITLADGHPALLVAVDVTHSTNGSRTGGTSSSGRLDLLDPIDGHRRATMLVETTTTCATAVPGLLWCGTNYGRDNNLELRDSATLALKASRARLVAGAPSLSRDNSPTIEGDEAWFMTSDGHFWHVDPRTLVGHAADTLPVHDAAPGDAHQRQSSDRLTVAAGELSFEGSPSRLTLDDHHGTPRALGSDAFVRPGFVMDDATSWTSPLSGEGGNVLFIADADAGAVAITAVRLDGSHVWRTQPLHGELDAAWLIAGRLVLAVRGSKSEIVAIDPASGTIAWRTPA